MCSQKELVYVTLNVRRKLYALLFCRYKLSSLNIGRGFFFYDIIHILKL